MVIRFGLLWFYVTTCVAVLAQCPADSVFTYMIVSGTNKVASAEYYVYDEQDSLIQYTLTDFISGKAVPQSENNFSYTKTKTGRKVVMETKVWNQERGSFRSVRRYTKEFNKQNKLTAEITEKYLNQNGNDTWVFETKITHLYAKTGEEIQTEFFYWMHDQWVSNQKIQFVYLDFKIHEIITEQNDTTSNSWHHDSKILCVYDSTGNLYSKTFYTWKNEAWLPVERTVYGKENGKPVNWIFEQEWNCAKQNWTNKFYHVMELNSDGTTRVEVHLTWTGKDWEIQETYQFVYTEYGALRQIKNQDGSILVDRYCRNF
ncbi:MAG: hypothetical protein IPM74_01480 [Crocinitomicaceae bacterium]|nr:hypothetical protein [Crocinitomicaceae bacterium]MBK8924588.1 hypothetical protein [Crocinitomicaceae bacterium]